MDDSQFIIDRIDTMDSNINQRMDVMESNMKDHLKMCRDQCGTRLTYVETETTKLHERLNDHKKSIECLCKHKNETEGWRKGTTFYMAVITIIIAVLGLLIAFYR